MEPWGFAISFATRKPGKTSEYIGLYVEGCLFKALTFRAPYLYADQPPIIRHWQSVLNYFRY